MRAKEAHHPPNKAAHTSLGKLDFQEQGPQTTSSQSVEAPPPLESWAPPLQAGNKYQMIKYPFSFRVGSQMPRWTEEALSHLAGLSRDTSYPSSLRG